MESMNAILLAFASAAFLGGGVVITQFGLRHVHPLSGAAISIPTFTAVFVLASPILLHGETVVWSAVPIFAAVGLVFPALLTLLTFASNRALGPVVTSTLGNLSPLFAVALAVVVLHEPLRPLQVAGLAVAVSGVLIITVTRTDAMRDWRTWALLLPLGAALMRGIVPPVIKIGLNIWPNPIGASLVGYIFSSLTVLMVERFRNGSFIVKAPRAGRVWFAITGLCNGIGTLLLYAALGAGPVTLVAPLVATYPLITVGLSAVALPNVKVTARLLVGTVATVAGVVLILIG
ncbi:MAG TPA: EamA family transporter [Xanthobacteraceae bacterium]|jgi:drug/metabolite transporter (DMT)-like permease|nr:EamA family transporter [Xanthobacteraceae bacterium]